MNPAAHRSARPRRHCLAALLAGVVLTLVAPVARAQGRNAVIPPGQEAQVLAMLGGPDALPGQCHLHSASIEGAEITARYDCPGAQPVLRLRHPDRATPGDVRTDRFALSPAPAFPAPLLDDVVARVRRREAAFHWLVVDPDRHAADGSRHSNLPRALPVAALLAVALACAGSLARRGTRRDHAARIDAATTLALFAIALGVRLLLPWGPGDFAEPERLTALWDAGTFEPGFETVPSIARLAEALGASLATALRWLGPTVGALNVAAVYLLARTAVGRPAAIAAALALLALPAHAHYSATPGIAVAGPAFWTLAWAVAAAPEPVGRRRVALVAALAGLAAQSRPEMRALVLTLVPLALGPGWSPQRRWLLAAFVAVALVPAGIDVVRATSADVASGRYVFEWLYVLPRAAVDARRGAPWVIAASVAGLALGRAPVTLRVALALGCALLLTQYLLFGGETNPTWSSWRYLSGLVPALCVGAAMLAERAAERRRAVVVGGWVALSLAGFAQSIPRLRRPTDLGAELDFLRERTRAALGPRRDAWILAGPRPVGRSSMPYSSTVLLGLALGAGSRDSPRDCDQEPLPDSGGLRVWAAEPAARGCAHPPGERGDAAVFLGAYTPPDVEAALRARWVLVPLAVESLTVASTAPPYAVSCRPLPATDGLCALRLGWYAMRPR